MGTINEHGEIAAENKLTIIPNSFSWRGDRGNRSLGSKEWFPLIFLFLNYRSIPGRAVTVRTKVALRCFISAVWGAFRRKIWV